MVQYQEPYPAATRGDRWGAMTPLRRRLGLGPHRGQDWAPGDVPARAIADGVIVAKYPLSGSKVLGNVVVVKHADGMYSGYCHLERLPAAPVGSRVERGKSIGADLGETGSAAAGRHLHLTLSRDPRGVFLGVTVDPLAWIQAHDDAPKPKPAAAPSSAAYTVKDGDTLSGIAEHHGVPWQRVAQLNGLAAPYLIHPGDRLRLK